MTVRELINALLDMKMDAEVLLKTADVSRPDCSGVVFHIDKVYGRNYPTIEFEDWRDGIGGRKIKECNT